MVFVQLFDQAGEDELELETKPEHSMLFSVARHTIIYT
jgi:hypothetical protein